jgi:hypothetical protein
VKTAVSGEFWPVTAQVIPVLALATVLEARAIIQKWTKEIPRWLRFAWGVTWTTPLILLAVTELFAFRELAGDWASTSAWVAVAQLAIGLSLAVLVLTPALDLFLRSNAWIIVRGFFQVSSIISRRKIRQSLRGVNKMLAENTTNRRWAIASLERVDTLDRRIHEFGDTVGDADSQEVREMLAENEALRSIISEMRVSLEEEEGLLFAWQTILQQAMKDTKEPDRELLERIDQELMRSGDFDPKEIKSLGQMKFPQDKLNRLNARMDAFMKKHDTDE